MVGLTASTRSCGSLIRAATAAEVNETWDIYKAIRRSSPGNEPDRPPGPAALPAGFPGGRRARSQRTDSEKRRPGPPPWHTPIQTTERPDSQPDQQVPHTAC